MATVTRPPPLSLSLSSLHGFLPQDLMVRAAHAQRRGSLQRKSTFMVCFALLEAFHSNKKERGVDEMLLRLYDPILWRSTQVRAVCVCVRVCACVRVCV